MTTFDVAADDLRAALKAVLPFVPKPTAKEDESREEEALIHAHLLDGQRLWLTARSEAGLALTWCGLGDFDGELTDFAIHRSDADLLARTFRRKDRSLELRVTHQEYTAPPVTPKGLPRKLRSTSVEVEELGQLFGAATLAFAGMDGRAARVRSWWAAAANFAADAARAAGPDTIITPHALKLLAPAADAFGAQLVWAITEEGHVVATIGNQFVAALPAYGLEKKGPSYGAEDRSAWASKLNQAIPQIVDHRLFVAEMT